MDPCVIAADMLNEVYQSVEVWHEGWARMKTRKGQEKKHWREKGAIYDNESEETNTSWQHRQFNGLSTTGHKNVKFLLSLFI